MCNTQFNHSICLANILRNTKAWSFHKHLILDMVNINQMIIITNSGDIDLNIIDLYSLHICQNPDLTH